MSPKLTMAPLTAFILGLSVTPTLQAETSLPYIGPVMHECKINQPEGPEWADKDAGYRTDEGCKIIYVKPPILGKFKMADPIFLNQTQDCPDLNAIRANLTKNYRRRVDKLVGDAFVREVALYKKSIAELEQIGSESTAAFVSAGALLAWNDLLTEYKKINPEKTVRQMPIATGLFSSKRVTPTIGGDIFVSGGKIIRNLEVHGIELPSDVSQIEDFPLPDYLEAISGSESKPFLMGQAMALSLELNLNGACALLDNQLNLVSSPDRFLSATYTYFYPVQTKLGFEIGYEIERIKEALNKALINKSNILTAEELSAVITKNGGITIDLHSGAFPGDSTRAQELLTQYKAEIEEYLSEVVLLSLSTAVDVAINDAKYTEVEGRTKRVCTRPWYRFGGKKCNNHHYTVNVEKIDWKKVKDALDMYKQKTRGGVSEYISYYMMDSVAFVPQYKSQNKVAQLPKK